MQLSVTVKNDIGNIRKELRAELSRAVKTAAFSLEADMKQRIMDSPASGHVYGKHQASAPGEAPATDQGTLVNSIGTHSVDDLHSVVSVDAEYALYLEMGTVAMAPRPFITPAVAAIQPKFEQAVKKALDKSTRGDK